MADPANAAATDRSASLQVLRGLAALAVVLYHAAHYAVLNGAPAAIETVFSGTLAYFGVITFFVLSGFLMQGAVQRYRPLPFLLHRAARLYPTYWLVFLVFFVIQSLRAGALETLPWKALTLLPVAVPGRPLAVEWTLVYEVFFYAVCTLLARWPRLHLPAMLLWLGAIVLAVRSGNPAAYASPPTFEGIVFSVWNLGFICGGLAGHANRWLRGVRVETLWLVAIALLLVAALDGALRGQVLTCSAIGLVVIAAARRGERATVPATPHRVLYLLGDWSYGLYLAHCLAIQIALQYIDPARLTAQPLTIVAGLVGVGLAAGIVAGSVDVRLYRALKARIDARFAPRAAVALPEPMPP